MGRRADHFGKKEFELFLTQESPKHQAREIVRHLLSGCHSCLALARELILPASSQPDLDGYDEVFRRLEILFELAEDGIAAERGRAAPLWARLRTLNHEQRLLLIRNHERYQIWAVYELALSESIKTVRIDALAATDLASLALEITVQLDGQYYGVHRLHDFRAAALAALANAKRLIPDFIGCEQALQEARRELDLGTGDALDEANLFSIQGSYLTDIGELEQALASMDRARHCYHSIGDTHREGKILLQQASAIGEIDPLRGVTLARRALALLDHAAEPYLTLGAWHVLAFDLNLLGETREAERILRGNRHLYIQLSDPITRGRLYRLEAWIARQKGELATAEELFRRQRTLCIEGRREFELSLATVELAEILTLQSRIPEALEILAKTYVDLESWGLSVDVLYAWGTIEKNIALHAASAQAFRELSESLQRNWKRR